MPPWSTPSCRASSTVWPTMPCATPPPAKPSPSMNSSVAPEFWDWFNRLHPDIQERARKQYALWLQNHTHPSLHFKKVGRFWSVRIDDNHRALGIESSGTILWFFIGPHAAYEDRI